VLLCNLLLGFGLDAYVAIGTNSEGSHAWVLTRRQAGGKAKVDFWESLTGTKMDSDDPRVHRFYRTIGSVFNHKSFMGNIQADDRVVNTNWDFEDEYMWKQMSASMLNTLSSSTGIGYLMPSTRINVQDEEKLLEGILRTKIGSIRRNDHNLGTQWDS
jgi:centrosomal protein CEP76